MDVARKTALGALMECAVCAEPRGTPLEKDLSGSEVIVGELEEILLGVAVRSSEDAPVVDTRLHFGKLSHTAIQSKR